MPIGDPNPEQFATARYVSPYTAQYDSPYTAQTPDCSEVYIPLADRVDTLEMENSALRDRIDEIENRIALYNIKSQHRI